MKITDIKQQVKRQDRYSIYGDSKYVFSLSESELLGLGLKIGQEYDGQELDELRTKAVLDKAYDRSLNLISRRRRSNWEMSQYLKGKGYNDSEIEATLNKLSKNGYLNDSEFAKAWVNNRRLLKSTSKRRLSQELRAKRVSDGIINETLENDEANDQDVLDDIIRKKQAQTRYQDPQKLMAYLVRQGFNYGDIKDALNRLEDKI